MLFRATNGSSMSCWDSEQKPGPLRSSTSGTYLGKAAAPCGWLVSWNDPTVQFSNPKRISFGDFNNDGNTDILWRDTSGNTAIWFMNGLQIGSTAGVGNIPTTWTVQGVNAD
jgi:hypothetical protein